MSKVFESIKQGMSESIDHAEHLTYNCSNCHCEGRCRANYDIIGKDSHRMLLPCEHEKCELCKGSGVKSDGQLCIHLLSCQCLKCQPSM